ncbi:MAG TPA: efflux transporter outer membrane subunit [Stellaceae bacterium]|nr:efflux transporter outer membrane subunit [Stellaceae bacterium]
MMRRAHSALTLAASAALLVGCEVGPDFQRPAAPQATGYTPEPLPSSTAAADTHGGETQLLIAGRDIPGDWWALYRSPALNALIEDAIKANPNLDAARAALRQAHELELAGVGALFPTVSAGASATREKESLAGFGLGASSSIFSVNSASLTVDYALDIFGGTRRNIESLAAETEFERFELEATYLSLTANVVTAAVAEASLRGQIAATQQIIDIESQELERLNRDFAAGAANNTAVLQQAATLAQTRATLPPLEKALAQTRDLLAVLLGRLPSDMPATEFALADLELPQELPLTLPSLLVEQRPDIRAAEAQLHAASAQIGVALANMLPQLSLSGSLGTISTGAIFQPGTGVWSLGGSLVQPLFEGGTLLHRKRATEAAFDQAAAQYRQTVLIAFQNVADSLRALELDADALNAQLAAERAAADSLTVARRQFELGSGTYLTLLNAEQTYQQAHITLVEAQAARFSDTAALFQALGGGWWNRTDFASR